MWGPRAGPASSRAWVGSSVHSLPPTGWAWQGSLPLGPQAPVPRAPLGWAVRSSSAQLLWGQRPLPCSGRQGPSHLVKHCEDKEGSCRGDARGPKQADSPVVRSSPASVGSHRDKQPPRPSRQVGQGPAPTSTLGPKEVEGPRCPTLALGGCPPHWTKNVAWPRPHRSDLGEDSASVCGRRRDASHLTANSPLVPMPAAAQCPVPPPHWVP